MFRSTALIFCLVISSNSPVAAVVEAAESQIAPAQVEYFEKSVRPLLAANCFECHTEKQKGGLRLDSREAVLRGVDSGPVVVPGSPEQSRLIAAVGYQGNPKMPPKGRLSNEQIGILTTWVQQGAPWPDSRTPVRAGTGEPGFQISEEDRSFWSFQPIRQPPIPQVRDLTWPQSPLDHFVLSALEDARLRPVAAADKRTLLRRASFDLIGLPPSAEEVESFVTDDSPGAFARVVDRLLASPHYGERWGRHWLDVARYGEDQAHTFQARKYPAGFRYRDWLVHAFNSDLAYDRFVLHQIAGDLLEAPGRIERLPALGYFALGPVYYGDQKKLDQLDDRVDTLSRGFLGLTVACARCHNHKYDPISTEDYYALAGVFASSEYAEAPVVPPEVVEAYNMAVAPIDAQSQRIDRFVETEAARISHAMASDTARYMVAAWTLLNRRKGNPDISANAVAKEAGLHGFVLERWVKYLTPDSSEGRPYLAQWLRLMEQQDPQRDGGSEEPAVRAVTDVAQAFQNYVIAVLKLRDAIEAHRAAAMAISGTAPDTDTQPIALGQAEKTLLDDLTGNNGLFAIPKNRREEMLSDSSKQELSALKKELEQLKKDAPPKYDFAHSLTDAPSPANMKVYIRGNPDTPGSEVPRRFLAVLGGESQPFTQGSGRLELARAIASGDNPLTARVIVNRIWQHHFGVGLVATASNFGALGARPTHPELLDYLASRFMAAGWSIKTMHREIMLSAVYQLSSRSDMLNDERDPGNKLYWRMNRRRLEVEAWRDAILAVSGGLDRSLGGASLDLTAAENRRRTFYAAVSRHDLDPLLRLFDFPDPNITSAERPVTTVPLQQLFVLNSTFMVQNARALAARLCAAPNQDDRCRIERAFLMLFARRATHEELHWGLDYLGRATSGTTVGGDGVLTRWEQLAQVLLSTNEFMYVD